MLNPTPPREVLGYTSTKGRQIFDGFGDPSWDMFWSSWLIFQRFEGNELQDRFSGCSLARSIRKSH